MKTITYCLAFLIAGAFAAPNPRIVGGDDAERGQFPYQVSLQACFLGRCQHSCGASIISQNWILTAAHCRGSAIYTYNAIVGITNLQDTNVEKQTIRVSEIIIHPDYDNSGSVGPHDIALMRLSQPIQYSHLVQPIRLPSHEVTSGQVELSGWGSVGGTVQFPTMPQQLQKAILPIVSFGDCYNALRTIIGPTTAIPLDERSNICTGPLTGGLSACSGDSGGPLAKNGEVIGVVSWGITPCGSVGAPSVYAKVSNYISWIHQYVN